MAEHDKREASFMKSLFAGIIDQDTIFPYPQPPAEEAENIEMIVQTWREFAKDNIDPVQIDREEKIPNEVLQGLKEMGFFGLSVPEKYGGAGMSKTGYSRVFEEFCTIDASIAVTMGAHGSIGTVGLVMYGTESQKEKYLPKIATGEFVSSFALTEPGAGSDASGIQSYARLNDKKSHFILNGNKIWISNGGIADLWVVFAKTDVQEGGKTKKKITAFLVESAWPGCSSGKSEEKLGIHGTNTTPLNFDNVQVPVENVLGPIGKGFKVAMETLNMGRLSLAAGSVGGCKELIRMSVEYAKSRKQFGQPIANFGMIKDKISRMMVDTYAAESMVYLTSSLADRKGVDFSLESAISKVFASEALWRTVNETMQIAGGLGYSREYPYERYMRDARINLIFEGTNEILRSFVALAGMQEPGEYLKKIGKALRRPIRGLGLLTEFAAGKVKDKVAKDSFKNIDSRLKSEADHFAEYAAELHHAVENVLIKHGKEIVSRGFVLQRIANMAIDLYGMAAVISRVDSKIKNGESVQRDLPLAKDFCEQAWRRIRREARQVDHNSDDLQEEIAHLAYEMERYPFKVIGI